MKHALLVWLVRAMQRKPGGITVLDTHAGAGPTDLGGAAAQATGEWRRGIGRLRTDPSIDAYRAVAQARDGYYPGSPGIVRALLRPQDRLTCCELHPEDAASLRLAFAADAQVGVHRRDGYEALRALLPPPTTRGLSLIDPPFEQPDEAERMIDGLKDARARFATGVMAAWYPIKHMAPVRALHRSAAGLRDTVAATLTWRAPDDPGRLNGSGLLVVKPPHGFEAAAADMLSVLRGMLGEAGAGSGVERLSDE